MSNIPPDELAEAFIQAGVEAGGSSNDDFNDERQEGFGYNQVTVKRGRRSSPATAFL